MVSVGSTHRVPRGDADLGLAVVAAVDMHIQDVLLGRVVVNDLGPLDHTARPEIAGTRLREQRADVRPFYQVRRRVAVDVLEG